MPPSRPSLEARRTELLGAMSNLSDMRRGSIVAATFRCRKPSCHCSRPGDPGHGPIMRLTYKVRGKTITEALPTPAAVRKAEQEIAEFRNYQQLNHELVEVSGQICRLRPIEETLTPEEKKRRRRSAGKSRAK
jgi:hypothetical protein